MKTNYETAIRSLLRRHGYRILPDLTLIDMGVRGFIDSRIVPVSFRSLTGICDYLLPLLGQEFSADYHATVDRIQ